MLSVLVKKKDTGGGVWQFCFGDELQANDTANNEKSISHHQAIIPQSVHVERELTDQQRKRIAEHREAVEARKRNKSTHHDPFAEELDFQQDEWNDDGGGSSRLTQVE